MGTTGHTLAFIGLTLSCIYLASCIFNCVQKRRKRKALTASAEPSDPPPRVVSTLRNSQTSQPSWFGREERAVWGNRDRSRTTFLDDDSTIGGRGAGVGLSREESANVISIPDEQLPEYPAPAYTEFASPKYEERGAGMV